MLVSNCRFSDVQNLCLHILRLSGTFFFFAMYAKFYGNNIISIVMVVT